MGQKLENMTQIGAATRIARGNPGAGKYNPDYTVSRKKLPSFSMLSRHEDAKKFDVPGPGAYTAVSKEKKQAPNYSFGSSP